MFRYRNRSLLIKAVCIFMLLCLTACSSRHAGKVKTPSGMKIQRGRNYKEVIEDFEDKGFKNIKTEEIQDLRYNWTFKYGQVETISVGGDTDYDAGVWVPEETEVIISYHTYITGYEQHPRTEDGEKTQETKTQEKSNE